VGTHESGMAVCKQENIENLKSMATAKLRKNNQVARFSKAVASSSRRM
jgi:hypothetical protein